MFSVMKSGWSSTSSWVIMLTAFAVMIADAEIAETTSNQTLSNNSTGNDLRFPCINSNITFELHDVCDGDSRCPYNDDEVICDNKYCNPSQYQCVYEESYTCTSMQEDCEDSYNCKKGNKESLDQLLCDLIECEPSCQCTAFRASCRGPHIVHDHNISKSTRALYFLGESINETKMPVSIPFNLSTYPLLLQLYVRYTGLTEILRSDFANLTELNTMILRFNDVSWIEDFSFSHSNKLKILDLSFNGILSLSRHTFTGLTSLVQLSLSYNDISQLEDFTFSDLNKLTDLHLYNNVITSLTRNTFAGLNSLDHLDLRFNRIAVIPEGAFRSCYNLNHLFLRSSGIVELEPGSFQGLSELENLVLYVNNITSLPSGVFTGLDSIMYLHLSHNQISHIGHDAFRGLLALEHLDLTNNLITEFTNGMFDDQSSLTWLSFSDNPLKYIEPGTFKNLCCIEYINLVNVELDNLQPDTFTGISSLKGLSTDDYRLCCLFDETDLCTIASTNFLDSCSRLMPNTILRIAMWVIGWGALIGNTIVLVLRCRTDRSASAKTQGLFITNLAIADFLMGVYMIIISSADVYYGKYFYLYAAEWRGSVTCKAAGFIAVLSSETSVFILAIITMDRVLCVVFPFGKLKFRATSARVGVVVIWITAFVVSIVPLIVSSYISGFYGLSDVCVGLPLNVESTQSGELVFNNPRRVWEYVEYATVQRPSWVYSIVIFLGVNFLIFILILICYVVIFVSVRKSARSVANPVHSGSDHAREVRMATRMAIIILTDFFCWMPVIIMGILSQSGAVSLPTALYAWSVVFILPINASINPYIYTFIATCGGSKTKSNPASKTRLTMTSDIM